MRAEMTWDDKKILAAFEGLSPKGLRSATKIALGNSARVIKRAVVREYKAAYPGSQRYKAIHMKVWKDATGATVDLKYIPRKYAHLKPYVMRFQSAGTDVRTTTKLGLNRGRMPASRFFSKGAYAAFREAQQRLVEEIGKQLLKKAEKEGLT